MASLVLLKKYAVNYLSKYSSTKKNLERILSLKINRIKNINKSERLLLNKSIYKIIEEFESKRIINDEIFSETKINSFFAQGKSEYFIINTLIKKGVEKSIIIKSLKKFENDHPDWKIQSAELFARKKKLGKFGLSNNKEKDLSKMARAGFAYDISLKILGYQ